jgi:cobalt-zinc-cadmium efflux system protein
VKAIAMSHDHSGHSHDHRDHDHGHAPATFGKAFAIGITLNLGFVIIEAFYGLMSNSVSLLVRRRTQS